MTSDFRFGFDCHFFCLGEADFTSKDGSKEIYNLKIDFNKEIIQLTLLQEFHQGQGRHRRDLSSEENLALNMTKIVVQDYKNVSVLLIRVSSSHFSFILIFFVST